MVEFALVAPDLPRDAERDDAFGARVSYQLTIAPDVRSSPTIDFIAC